MNLLKNATIYLAGPIDRTEDFTSWRNKFIELTQPIGLKILDPTNKPEPLKSETSLEKGKTNKLKENKDWDTLTRFAKDIRRVDLRLCDYCQAVVVFIDPDVHMFGTIDEIIMCERQQKPVIAIVKGGKQRLSLWGFAVIDHNLVFETVEECVEYLEKLNNGTIPLDKKWILINEYLYGN